MILSGLLRRKIIYNIPSLKDDVALFWIFEFKYLHKMLFKLFYNAFMKSIHTYE